MSRGLVIDRDAHRRARNDARARNTRERRVPAPGTVEIRVIGTPAQVIAASLAIAQVMRVEAESRDFPSKHDTGVVLRYVTARPKEA